MFQRKLEMEMEFEQINLNWEKHESTISQGFQALREAKELFDVTLACKDGQLEAHKVILSSCSPRFKEVLKEKVPAYSTIYLHGLQLCHLVAVVDFMYRGRVVIEKRDLDDFLNLAREWQVKGLSVCHKGSGASTNKKSSNGCWEIRNQPTILFSDDHIHLLGSRAEHRNTNFRNYNAR